MGRAESHAAAVGSNIALEPVDALHTLVQVLMMLLLLQLCSHGKVGRLREHAVVAVSLSKVGTRIVSVVLSQTVAVVVPTVVEVVTVSVDMNVWSVVMVERLVLGEVSNRLFNLVELVVESS